MKKIISLILALVLCLSLCGCGANNDAAGGTQQPTITPTTPTVAPTQPTPTEGDTTPVAPTEGHTHEWKEATCTEAKTCSTCGTTEGNAAGHQWTEATCKAPKTCSVCNATEGTVGNHSYKEATCTSPSVCNTCGQTSGNALGCTAGANGTCIRCGKSMIAISSVLSKPKDAMSELSFLSSYYRGDCYNAGNFRLIFNTANGVILSWGATNTADKDIKYITFTIHYYNNVGDPARDSITGKTSYTARLTGPVGAGKSFYLRQLIGYGSDIMYGEITEVKIEYMDGSSITGNYGYTTWHNIRTGASPKECFVIEK